MSDLVARRDWGWKPDYNLQSMTKDMLHNLKTKLNNNKYQMKVH
jgi:nucleoside-diphosphate-sugar epimerase